MKCDLTMTLSAFYEQVFRPLQLAGRSPSTLKIYHSTLRRFRGFAGREMPIGDVTQAMVAEFLAKRREKVCPRAADQNRYALWAVLHMARPVEFPALGTGYELPKRRPDPIQTDAKPGTLWHLFLTSYRPKKLRGGSENTTRQYRVQLNHFAKFLGHEPSVADLDEDVVSACLDRHATGRSAYTANKLYWCLMALWRHAAKKRLVEEFPTIPPMLEPQRVPRAWTIEEIGKLLESCRKENGDVCGIAAAHWWFALCLFCFTTGERKGAALAVRMVDVDLTRGEVLIPAEARKGKRLDMLYRLHPETLDALTRIREPDRELLFPFRGHVVTFYSRFTRILKRAGLPSDRKCKVQKLRRTFASYVEAGGGDATKALAHSSRSIAVKSYLDTRICGGRNPSDLLPPIPLRKDGAA